MPSVPKRGAANCGSACRSATSGIARSVSASIPTCGFRKRSALIFARFRELGSARQVLLSLVAEQVHFPRPSDGKKLVAFEWTPIRYRSIISVLKNPFYAGVYAYGKGEKRTEIVDGRARKSYGHRKPLEEWEVLLKDHHEGYIDWSGVRTQSEALAANAYSKPGGMRSLGAAVARCSRGF